MNTYRLLKMYESMIASLHQNGFEHLPNLKDIEIYEHYLRMMKEKHKKEYIYYVLTDNYGISRNTIIRLVQRMERRAKV